MSNVSSLPWVFLSMEDGYPKKKKKNLMVIVGSEGSRGFGPFHLKPKAHAEEEEVPMDE